MGRERELITVAKAWPMNDIEDQYRGGSGNQAVVAGLASPGCPGGTEGPGSSKAQVRIWRIPRSQPVTHGNLDYSSCDWVQEDWTRRYPT